MNLFYQPPEVVVLLVDDDVAGENRNPKKEQQHMSTPSRAYARGQFEHDEFKVPVDLYPGKSRVSETVGGIGLAVFVAGLLYWFFFYGGR